jgi:hypothetical protein
MNYIKQPAEYPSICFELGAFRYRVPVADCFTAGAEFKEGWV